MNARELQTLRNLGNECEQAADEIERLTAELQAEKAEVFRLQASHSLLYAEVEALRKALDGWKIDEGKLWSFLRTVIGQGVDIAMRAEQQKWSYEVRSAHLDAASSERADQWIAAQAGERT